MARASTRGPPAEPNQPASSRGPERSRCRIARQGRRCQQGCCCTRLSDSRPPSSSLRRWQEPSQGWPVRTRAPSEADARLLRLALPAWLLLRRAEQRIKPSSLDVVCCVLQPPLPPLAEQPARQALAAPSTPSLRSVGRRLCRRHQTECQRAATTGAATAMPGCWPLAPAARPASPESIHRCSKHKHNVQQHPAHPAPTANSEAQHTHLAVSPLDSIVSSMRAAGGGRRWASEALGGRWMGTGQRSPRLAARPGPGAPALHACTAHAAHQCMSRTPPDSLPPLGLQPPAPPPPPPPRLQPQPQPLLPLPPAPPGQQPHRRAQRPRPRPRRPSRRQAGRQQAQRGPPPP